MVESTEGVPELGTVVTDNRQVVAEIMYDVEEAGESVENDKYSRGPLSEYDQKKLLEYMARFEPEVRANVYLSYGLEAMTTPETMSDAAIFLYSFAWQDHNASRAVEDSRVEGVNQGGYDPNGVFIDPDWYMDHISHHGNAPQAKEYLENMFHVSEAEAARQEGMPWIEGMRNAIPFVEPSDPKYKPENWFGSQDMTQSPEFMLQQTIKDGLTSRRDQFPSVTINNVTTPGLATGGDRIENDFENVLNTISSFAMVIAVAKGVKYDLSRFNATVNSPFSYARVNPRNVPEFAQRPAATRSFLGPYATAPGPVGPTGAGALGRATQRAVFHPFSTLRHGFAPRPPAEAMSQLELAGLNKLRPFVQAAQRANMSPEQVMNVTATYSPTGTKMASIADRMYQSRFIPTSYAQIAGVWLFGNVAEAAGMAWIYPELVKRTSADVLRQQSEYNAKWTEAYRKAVDEGLEPEEARTRASEETGRSESSEGGPWLAGVEGPQAMGGSSPLPEGSSTATIDGAEENHEQAVAAHRREMDEVNNRVQKVRLRFDAVNDVADAAQAEYQRRYDKLKEEHGDDPNWTEDIYEKEASQGLPTEEEFAGAVGEVQDGTDVSSVNTFDTESVSAAATEIGKWALANGMRIGRNDVQPSEQKEAGEDHFVITDWRTGQEILIIGPEFTIEQQTELRELAQEPEEPEDTGTADEVNPFLGYEPGGRLRNTWFNRKLEHKYNAASMEERLAPDGAPQWRYRPIMEDIPTSGATGFGGGSAGGVQQVQKTAKPVYRESDVRDFIASMSTIQVFKYQQQALDAGLYTYDRVPVHGHISSTDISIIAEIMVSANGSSLPETRTFWGMLNEYAKTGKAYTAAEEAANKPKGTVKAPFSVPGHLRSIPGEKTVAEETKARFREKMGRDARPDELAGIADELTGYYQRGNQEEIALYLAAYNGDNQGLLTGAQMQRIEDPGAATSFDISETYANEIDLNKRRESNADSFQRMLAATMGGRSSIAGATAATGVQQVGRQ